MLRSVLNKSWKLQPTKQQLYDHLPSISQTIQIRILRYRGHSSRSKIILTKDFLVWTHTHGHTNTDRPAKTYIHRLSADIGYRLEDLQRAMVGMDNKKVKRILVSIS